MISANELRIGNIVNDEDLQPMYIAGLWPVNNGKQYNFKDSAGNSGNVNILSGIPLTEEWLIKLGFIKMPVNGYTYLLKISAATLQCRCNGDKWYFQFNDTYFGEMFLYVHQVQNFCASLGKELISA